MVDKNERGQDLLAAFAEGASLTDVELREALLAAHRQIGQLEIENVRLKEEVEDQATLLAVQGEHIDELTQELADTEVALAHSALETKDVREKMHASEAELCRTESQLAALEQKNIELEKTALTDPLTKMWTRKGGEIQYAKLVNIAIRKTRDLAEAHAKHPDTDPMGPQKAYVCVLFIDIDRFKLVNDAHGHGVGDKVLVSVANTLEEVVRDNDVLMRPGGEEMVCYAIVDAHDVQEAKQKAVSRLAERMRTTVKNTGYYVDETKHDLTISLGVDAFLPEKTVHVPTITELNNRPNDEVFACMAATERADFLVYQAKENGRDAVVYDDEARGRPVIFGRENEVLVIKTKEEKAEEERSKKEAKEAEKQKKGPQPLPLIDHMRKHVSGFQWPRTAPHP